MGKYRWSLIRKIRYALVLFFLVISIGKVTAQEVTLVEYQFASDGDFNPESGAIGSPNISTSTWVQFSGSYGNPFTSLYAYNREYIDVSISTVGYENIKVEWEGYKRSNANARWRLYADNGSGFGGAIATHSCPYQTWGAVSELLSSASDDNANVTIRIEARVNSGSISYLDNLKIKGTPIIVKPTIDLVKSFEESCNGNDGIVQFYETTPAIDSGIEFSKDDGSTWQSSAVFTGLSAGNYSLRVRNGSVVSDPYSITVGQFSQLTANANVSHANCGNADGSIDVTVSGGRSGSMQTDGSTGVIDLQGRLLSGLGAFSLEGWVRLNQPVSAYNSGQHSFFGQNDVIEFGFENGAFTCWTASGGNIKEALTNYPDDQKWHHVAVVGTGSSLKLFIDGNVVETRNHSSISSYGNNTGYSAKIGAGVWDPGTTSEPFEGVFSDVRFWDDARSDAEILNNRNTNIQGNEQGLIAVYKMNTPPDANKIYGIGPKATIGTINSGATWIDTNPVYTYSWTGPGGFSSTDEDISNLQSGSYTLTVKDLNNCTVSQVFQVNEISGFTASASADKSNICEGESVQLQVDSPVDSSMLFDGSDDWLLVPSHNSINLQSVSSRTIMLRFKPKDITTRQVLYEEGAAVNGF